MATAMGALMANKNRSERMRIFSGHGYSPPVPPKRKLSPWINRMAPLMGTMAKNDPLGQVKGLAKSAAEQNRQTGTRNRP